jgi:hypothetical protein
MPLLLSQTCQRLQYTNLGDVGKCLNEVTLGNDPLLGGIILTIMFIGLLVRYNFPMTLLLPFGMALSYGLWLISGSDIYLGIFMLTIMAGGAVLILAMLKAINR